MNIEEYIFLSHTVFLCIFLYLCACVRARVCVCMHSLTHVLVYWQYSATTGYTVI
jgi:hypothetical protein